MLRERHRAVQVIAGRKKVARKPVARTYRTGLPRLAYFGHFA
jgi:hypothetical protein